MSSDETLFMEIQSSDGSDQSSGEDTEDAIAEVYEFDVVDSSHSSLSDDNAEEQLPNLAASGSHNEVERGEQELSPSVLGAEAVNNVDEQELQQSGAAFAEACVVKVEVPSIECSPMRDLHNKSVDEEGQICTICFEPWTSSSEHRLVSLKCGHLFGRSCINRWLKGQGSRCPQCNAKARKQDIRPIYARTLKVLDTSERDRALKELEKECELRRKSELEAAQMRLKFQMALQECERLKKELIETQMLLREARSNGKYNEKLSQMANVNAPKFSLEKSIELCKVGGCRVMDVCDLLGMLVVSQPSTNPLFPGYGLKKVSVPDLKLSEFVCMHQKPIKDVAFHSHDGLILTASLDRTVKLTNFLSNSVVQTYNLDSDVWSCTWDADDPCYFFAGVKTGVVYLFDIRITGRYVNQLPRAAYSSPVVSMQYLRRIPSAQHSKCGPIVGQLSSCYFYEKLEGNTSYAIHPLPLEGKFTSLSCDPATGHFLASCRPSLKHPRVTHTLCELSYEQNTFSCNVVQSVFGGSTQVQLTRSKLLAHPDNDSSVLVCAGDEDSKAALIWDGSTGTQLDCLKADTPVLDLSTYHSNHRSLFTTLTEKHLRVYSWSNK